MDSNWRKKVDGTLYAVNQSLSNWDDFRVSIESTGMRGVKDPDYIQIFDNGSGSTGIFAYAFHPSSEEEVFFSIQMPHAWKEGTSVRPHIHWIGQTNGGVGQDVCWGLEYTVANIGSVYGNTSIIYADTNYLEEDIVANKHYMTIFPFIDMTGLTLSNMILCRLFRDAGSVGGVDDYPNDAVLLEFDLHYEIDSLGSQLLYTKEA